MMFSEWWKENHQRALEGLKTDPYRILEDCWNESTFSTDPMGAHKSKQLIKALREIVATITDGNTCRYIAREALKDLGLPLIDNNDNDELNIGNRFIDRD